MLQITYSYWDGIGHRKIIQVRKGTTIGRYLELVKQQVCTKESTTVLTREEIVLSYYTLHAITGLSNFNRRSYMIAQVCIVKALSLNT